MTRLSAAVIAAGLFFVSAPAFAVDGHGNATNPSLSVPNTGQVSGGPRHRDDAATNPEKDGKPKAHHTGDGHAHDKK